ncbi:homeodomain-interacting protein kinase 1-like [Synchiropus splendidus]|uniref:homeodomain-interacting protein kinase 1-like n=1 Tax=Synchiropus splendidus TaxID=270530 RepID=UPI00237D8286|nr:homeodomain-interacting protein kinase 1-like [Synchiropus splendidus]
MKSEPGSYFSVSLAKWLKDTVMFRSAKHSASAAVPPAELKKGDVLRVKSGQYLVMDFIGEGAFGRVAKCLDTKSEDMVAIKIFKSTRDSKDRVREMSILDAIKSLDPEKKNVVRFISFFGIQKNSFLVFEMLDRSLSYLLRQQKKRPLSLNEIRPITHQLLVALDALKGIGILHTDVKPDNIMLVNHKDLPYRVKLIDFGNGIPTSKVHIGMSMQPPSLRAPEVTLGLPISEAVDMWGLGCVLAFLYFGFHIFPGRCNHRIKVICQLLGQPRDKLLDVGLNTNLYFSKKENGPLKWMFRFANECFKLSKIERKLQKITLDSPLTIDLAVHRFYKIKNTVECKDKIEFLGLLKWMLQPESKRRVCPSKALLHSFVTMSHLTKQKKSCSYVTEAVNLMAVVPKEKAGQ